MLHRDYLKSQGFRKAGLNWSTRGNWSHHIGFSLNRWNTPELAKLRIEAGIFIPEFHAARESPAVKGTPKCYQCAPQLSGFNGPAPSSELNWEVTLTHSAEALAKAWREVAEGILLPWLREFSSFETVAAEFEQQHKLLDAAVAHALAGDHAAAAGTMKQAYRQIHPTAVPFAQHIAEKLQIN